MADIYSFRLDFIAYLPRHHMAGAVVNQRFYGAFELVSAAARG
ncbi:hypothetical protein [uncultured Sneathiella sp.]|tara:strand:+ start:17741 stop:17869 length:129 start_codon:yes stop_codon:yes gene_type:complete